ncbi:universal stress protein [Actinomycetospora lutea]|uniref:universal stress protein n=1 Tax=Actinomycetospora lutea TaxID=663604 RepID=UPI0023654CE5|nr:universal stress protein [Actinomycetospora lutea]MDD7939626.1 universal stress protein [Actinomycetospora lutea]
MIDHSVPPTGVLVGVDGSPATHNAVAWAAREAARRRSTLVLIQVLPPSDRPHDETRGPSGRALALLGRARNAAHAAAPHLPVHFAVVDGVVGPALAATAARADLLVLGARPRGAVIDAGVGRTAAHAMGHAACPVVIVPSHWDPGAETAPGVLVGVDGSPEAAGALAFGADVADRDGASLTAVTVTAGSGEESDEDARRHLAEATTGITSSRPDLPLHEVVRQGQPAEEILAEARAGAALVAVGSRGHGAIGGVLIGSTSQRVVRGAPCPVAVLSPPAAAAWAREHSGAGEAT